MHWDGACYVVGKTASRTPDENNKRDWRIAGPRYYPTLKSALEALPERVAAEIWNDCQNWDDFDLKIGVIAEEMLGKLTITLKWPSGRAQNESRRGVDGCQRRFSGQGGPRVPPTPRKGTPPYSNTPHGTLFAYLLSQCSPCRQLLTRSSTLLYSTDTFLAGSKSCCE